MEQSKYILTESLTKRLNQMDAKTKEAVFEYMTNYINQYKTLLNDHPPEEVAHSFQDHLQEFLDKSGIIEAASCKKACSFCCYISARISKEEATLLAHQYESIIESKSDILSIQSKCSTEEDYGALPYKQRACIFLAEDGNCNVYEHRPIACRKHYAKSSPELCSTEETIHGGAWYLVSDIAEIIASAILSSTDHGFLPQMILKAQAEK